MDLLKTFLDVKSVGTIILFSPDTNEQISWGDVIAFFSYE
jgi:hypothetical protein